MTVIGFTVSTMFIVFVCTRLICARIHYLTSRPSFRLSSRSDLSALERGMLGVEPVIVANFPTKKYKDPFFSGAVDAQCTVCLSEFRSEDTLRILPFCGHFFHSTCIDIWLQQHCTCPICRVSLHELSVREHAMHSLSQENRISNGQGCSRENEPEAAQSNLILNDGCSSLRDLGKKQDESTSNA